MTAAATNPQPTTAPPPRRPSARWRDQRQLGLALDAAGEHASARADRQGRGRRPTPRERYLRMRADHPEVYDEFVRLAREMLARGVRCTQRAIWEHMRMSSILRDAPPEDGYRYDDACIAYCARDAMIDAPELAQYFRLRRLRS